MPMGRCGSILSPNPDRMAQTQGMPQGYGTMNNPTPVTGQPESIPAPEAMPIKQKLQPQAEPLSQSSGSNLGAFIEVAPDIFVNNETVTTESVPDIFTAPTQDQIVTGGPMLVAPSGVSVPPPIALTSPAAPAFSTNTTQANAPVKSHGWVAKRQSVDYFR